IFVGDFLQHPRLSLFAGARFKAEHHPFALHPLAFEREVEVTLLNRLSRVLARRGDPAADVPQHDRAATIFTPGNCALEIAVIERMVLGPHREALLVRIEARALRNRPAFEDSVQLEAEIPVQARCFMLLDDETVALALELAPARLLRLGEVALAIV